MSILVLTGERGVGKTTVCYKTVALARTAGYRCAGIITFSRPDDEREVLDVSTGETRCLTAKPDTASAVHQGRFYFDPHVLEWGNRVLAAALPCHLLVVDELGPLEIERGEGWVCAFTTLREAAKVSPLSLLVVRPELVARVCSMLPVEATITVNAANRDSLPYALLHTLKSPGPLLHRDRPLTSPGD